MEADIGANNNVEAASIGLHTQQQVLGADSPMVGPTAGTVVSGAPLARMMFSPQERALMNQYAALQRQLTPLPGTVNYSNTAPVLRMLINNARRGIFASLGAVAAGPIGTLAGVAGGRLGKL